MAHLFLTNRTTIVPFICGSRIFCEGEHFSQCGALLKAKHNTAKWRHFITLCIMGVKEKLELWGFYLFDFLLFQDTNSLRSPLIKSSQHYRQHEQRFHFSISTLGLGWSLSTSDLFPVITCLSHCSRRVEVSFLLLLLHTLGHYHKYGTLTLVPCLSGYKLSLQVSHRGLPLILIKAW